MSLQPSRLPLYAMPALGGETPLACRTKCGRRRALGESCGTLAAVCILYVSSNPSYFLAPRPSACSLFLPRCPGLTAGHEWRRPCSQGPARRGSPGVQCGELRVGPVFVGSEDLSVASPRRCARPPVPVEPCQPSSRGTREVTATSKDWPSDVGCLVHPLLNYVVEINLPPCPLPVTGP